MATSQPRRPLDNASLPPIKRPSHRHCPDTHPLTHPLTARYSRQPRDVLESMLHHEYYIYSIPKLQFFSIIWLSYPPSPYSCANNYLIFSLAPSTPYYFSSPLSIAPLPLSSPSLYLALTLLETALVFLSSSLSFLLLPIFVLTLDLFT